MPQIIGSTYEIIKGIGSGGGGDVFLAKHLRLDKLVVLKADKRKITAKQETLRREVDALKNLSHTYIPQVYDFFIDGDTVYTVMDYIEGESLDKPLARGNVFPQAQVITWACQLLEALVYLHSRPPYGILHSDIKPANVMLTPEGDIRLIDFNIALALKEEGAVYVGRSRGYASPEHYGQSFSISRDGDATEVDKVPLMHSETDATEITGRFLSSSSGSLSATTTGRKVLVDKRSDIYSLGATLYHLLSGVKPAERAIDVKRLLIPGVSDQVADIIAKAMNPNPEGRFQSAEEMLDAFKHLHARDKRVIRFRRRKSIVAACVVTVFFAGVGCILGGIGKMQAEEEEKRIEAEEAERNTREHAQIEVAAEREMKEKSQEEAQAEKEKKIVAQKEKDALAFIASSSDRLMNGDRNGAYMDALRALDLETVYDDRAQLAMNNALGIYDVFDGFKYELTVNLPSEVLKFSLSPNGKKLVALSSGFFSVFDTLDGTLLAQLDADPSALSDAVFVDNDTLIYAAADGIALYRVSTGQRLWTVKKGTSISLSDDGSRVATVYTDESVGYVYEVSTGEVIKTIDFGGRHQSKTMVDTFLDPEDNLWALNDNGSWLAMSFFDGSISLYNLNDDFEATMFEGGSDFRHFEGGFFGDYFGACGNGSSGSFASILNLDDLGVQVSFPDSTSNYHLRVSEGGFFVSNEATIVYVDMESSNLSEAAFTSSEVVSFEIGENGVFVITSDERVCCFDNFANITDVFEDVGKRVFVSQKADTLAMGSFDSKTIKILNKETHKETEYTTYDGLYEHSESRITTDLKHIMQFDYKDFRVLSAEGEIVAEGLFPDQEQIYDQQFIRPDDHKVDYLEVTWYDGTVRQYSAENGNLISEVKKEAPDKSLKDEFFTEYWRIESPLHGTPEVYDRFTGEKLGELEYESYLTYVTQVGDIAIAQFINADGEQSGIALNTDMEKIAEMPLLCDVLSDGTLFFDDMKGNIRRSHINRSMEVGQRLAEYRDSNG